MLITGCCPVGRVSSLKYPLQAILSAADAISGGYIMNRLPLNLALLRMIWFSAIFNAIRRTSSHHFSMLFVQLRVLHWKIRSF